MRKPHMTSRVRQLALAPLAVCAAGLAINASPALAAQGSYSVTQQDGAPFSLLSTNDLVPETGSTDDALFRVQTNGVGAHKLPFQVSVYGLSYRAMTVSSNGNIQFGVCCSGGTNEWNNSALPSATFTRPAFAVFWDDLYFTPSDTSHPFREGIFTRTTGVAPHRQFIISWQGHSYSSESYFVLAQAVFTERSSTVKFRYGASDVQGSFAPSETIGVQGSGGTVAPRTQVAFNSVFAATNLGRQYTFTHH
jgi:hypothetical protein